MSPALRKTLSLLSRLLSVSLSVLLCASLFDLAIASAPPNPYPPGHRSSSDPLEVDLGYATYRGVASGLNEWFGIRYAEAPIGPLRWQRSLAPTPTSNGTVINATTAASICPQAPQYATRTPTPFSPSSRENEDCLFLNMWAPPNATNLPVLVWIHGGGYGGGDAEYDMPFMINSSKEKFIGVAIQYRLGAFGWLASEDVKKFGSPNAGLYDQYLALQWVHNYISLFGGDRSQVTIAGESAGAGSVMLHSMAFGGTLKESLFSRVWAASPYLPQQYSYADAVPSQGYYRFAEEAKCFNSTSSKSTEHVFQCLVNQESEVLQNASYTISTTYKFGEWAFLPVTDGDILEERPSIQLTSGKVNGKQALIGNNADEGEMFTPQNVTSEKDFIDFVHWLFPLFDDVDVQKVLEHYPIATTKAVDDIRFATDGTDNYSTAVTESPFATGQQQRANNLYAETTFVCPAQWMTEGFSTDGHESHKYQYSIIPALHGDDLFAYFNFSGSLPDNMGQPFRDSVVSFINSFVVTGTPTTQGVYNSTVPSDTANLLGSWPAYSREKPVQANLNQTGGILTTGTDPRDPFDYQIQMYVNPGLQPKFDLVDAYTWEGGRGARCDFWKTVGTKVPEKRS
ncbi:putative carboxylesterase [Talaromyces proteolyticus]|uniref:Carboxylic ester hydrolase n=1 Tax=Talaromyces proteolyticus TaxID=1131652 RepID=A0AAD4PUL9_9EURO|nr:putative carboxylesterase [Talaromyces proteolyticus]KAH8689520.1 putative carboxylesterase [Talaromyces proteolyticus]